MTEVPGIKLKICGLTNETDLLLAQDLGADFAGFVFYPGSTRFVDPGVAAGLIRKARSRPIRSPAFVGVFVNEDPDRVRTLRSACGLDIVQLHGHETPETCRRIGPPYWKAVRLKDESSLLELGGHPGTTFVLDAFDADRYGGSGRSFNPVLVRTAVERGYRIILAGGISMENVAEAVTLGPIGVDVCSSLEESPGKKSEKKMKAFFEKWRDLGGKT